MPTTTVESLKFDLILDDAKFNAQVSAAHTLAQQLNTELSNLLNTKKTLGQISKGHTLDLRDENRALGAYQRALKGVTSEADKQAKALGRLATARSRSGGGGDLAQQKSLLSSITDLAGQYVSLWGASKLVKSITAVTAEFELQRTTLRAILGDVQGADRVYYQMSDLALKSPFNFKELVSYAKQLSAYSIPMGELYDTTKMLADVSAGLGVGMDRLVLAYGQIRSASFLRGQEVRQLTEAGIPILEELRKQFVELGEDAVTVGDVFDKISSRLVPFEMVEKVFRNMTSEGGMFFEMQEKQAETLKGKLMILKDAYDKMFAAIGNENMGTLKGAVQWITNLARNYEKMVGTLKVLIATYGTYKTVMMAVAAYERTVAVAETITRLQRLTAQVQRVNKNATLLGVAFKTMSSATIAAGIGAIAAAVVALAVHIHNVRERAEALSKALNNVVNTKFDDARKLERDFDNIVRSMEGMTQGSENYREAISRLNNIYGDYLPHLLSEKNSLQEIRDMHDAVTQSIYAQAKAYAYEEGMRSITEKAARDLPEYEDNIRRALSFAGIAQDSIAGFLNNLENKVRMGAVDSAKSFTEQFGDALADYFGRDASVYTNVALWRTQDVEKYVRLLVNLKDAEDELNERLSSRFEGSTLYSNEEEQRRIDPIIKSYEAAVAGQKALKQSTEETNAAIRKFDIQKLRDMVAAYSELNAASNGAYTKQLKGVQQQLADLTADNDTWLQKLLSSVFDGKKFSELMPQQSDTLFEYVEKIRKEYKTAVSDFEVASDRYQKAQKSNEDADKESLKASKDAYESVMARKSMLEDIAKKLGVSIDDKLPASARSEADKRAEDELKRQIEDAKRLKAEYEDLRDLGLQGEQIRILLEAFFPDSDLLQAGMDFDTLLLSLADRIEKYDGALAASIRRNSSAGGLDAWKAQYKAQIRAGEEYRRFMDRWLEQSALDGTGAEFSISKIVNNYNKSLQKIATAKSNATRDLVKAYTEGNRDIDYAAEGMKILALSTVDARNALAEANESLRKLGDDWVKNSDAFRKFNLENMADMSSRSLRDLKEEIENFSVDDIPQELIEKIGKADGAVEAFIAGIREWLESTGAKVEEEMKDNVLDILKEVTDAIGTLADDVAEYADAIGNMSLKNVAQSLSHTAELTQNVMSGFTSAGPAGAAIAGVTTIASWMLKAATEAARLREEVRKAAVELARLNAEQALVSGVDSYFGTNTVRSIKNATNAINEYYRSVSALSEKTSLEDYTKGLYKGTQAYFYKSQEYYRQAIVSMEGYASKLGASLYNEDGSFNLDTLNAIDNTYNNLSKDEREWLEKAIADTEVYQSALKQLDGVVKDIWSNIADSMADSMLDAYIEMGDAAYDLAGNMDMLFSDLGQRIAKSLVSSFIIEEVIGQYKEPLKDLYKVMATGEYDNGEIARQFALIADNVTASAGVAANFTQQLLDAMRDYGIDFMAKGNGGSLASGITSITENTADVLAAYINGMRADLASQSADVKNISNDVKVLLGLVPKSYSLEEYLTRIEGYTADTAANTSDILLKLSSVIGDGASSFVRVQ